MARAYGANSSLLLKREMVYGENPDGNFLAMPFISSGIGSEQGLIDDPVLGQGRDPLQPLLDVINDEGDIVVPVDPRYLGFWLAGLFGDPISTDMTTHYTHEFRSGNYDLPSYTLEVGMPEVPAFYEHVGCRFNSIAFNFERSGTAQATVNVIAQGEARNNTSQGGTPEALTFNRISQFQGAIKQGGVSVANLTSGSLVYSNNMEKIETIRSDGKIDGADATIASLTGTITARYANNTLIDAAAAATPLDLEFSYTISSTRRLVMTAHEVFLPKPKLAIPGPGGVEASFDFRGAKDSGVGRMFTVVLYNDLDGAGYVEESST